MPKPLRKYQQMRDFGVTPEPKGKERPRRGKLPIFVVQMHAASHLHYDFRLEIEGVLKSWAVPKGPSYDPSTKRLAMMTEDHPYEYGAFEGVIPAGNYGGGNVIIWDEGKWEHLGPAESAAESVRKGEIKFRLDGKKLKGEWALIHLRGRSRKENEWLLVKHRDDWATSEVDVTELAPQSVVSGKLVEQMGDGKVWISNRQSGGGGTARTVADRLRQKKKANKASATAPAKERTVAKKAARKGADVKPASKTTRSKAKGATRPAARKK
ncbi:MAG: DNA polymerase ligase N-terminal domain-containing protein [Thermoanaerobaculia bacterium]